MVLCCWVQGTIGAATKTPFPSLTECFFAAPVEKILLYFIFPSVSLSGQQRCFASNFILRKSPSRILRWNFLVASLAPKVFSLSSSTPKTLIFQRLLMEGDLQKFIFSTFPLSFLQVSFSTFGHTQVSRAKTSMENLKLRKFEKSTPFLQRVWWKLPVSSEFQALFSAPAILDVG